MTSSYVGAVVISGLVIVFVALILLIIAVTVMGAVFKKLKADKKPADTPAKAAPAAPVRSAPAAPVPSAPAMEEDDTEVIAVIAAAVAAMSAESGVAMKIHSIKRAEGSRRSGAWARAAQSESTRVF